MKGCMQWNLIYKKILPQAGSKLGTTRSAPLSCRGSPVLRIIQREFFLFLNVNLFCDLSLEPSLPDGSNTGSQLRFYLRNIENYP